MAVDLVLDKKLLLPHLEATDNLDALSQIADNLLAQGYVKEGYKQAILDREAAYPTGLPSPRPTVAIPHANYQLVKKTTISVATLAHPVKFHDMGDIKNVLDVDVIIMMAIGQPHGQVEMLQKIVDVIQDDQLRHAIAEATDADALYQLLMKIFK